MSNEKPVELTEAERLTLIDGLHAKIARTLSEHRQSFGHNDEQFWSFCSCNENEPHVMEDGPDMPDPVEKRAFWATGVEIFAEHLAARAVDEVEEAGWLSPEEAKAREAAARREAEDDPAHARMYRALVERAERAESEVATARREALMEARGEVQRRMDAAESADGGKLQTWDALAGVMEWIEAALAEPERDEESGR